MKKIICFVLVLMMLVPAMLACKKDTGKDQESTNNFETVSGDHLEQRDYGGAKFVILSRQDSEYEFVGDSTGSTVQQNVVKRNMMVESRFNVKLETLTQPGTWDLRNKYIEYVQNNVMANDPTNRIHLGSTHASYLSDIALKGFAKNMTTLPNLDFNKEWWCPAYNENATIDGKMYFAVGDINLTLYERLEVMFFNKKVADNNKIGDLYVEALNGKWTYEMLYKISRDFGGSKEEGSELYAIAMNCHSTRALTNTWNIELTRKNAETGRDELWLTGNQKLLDGYNRFYRLMIGTVSHNPYTSGAEIASQAPLFERDQILFWGQALVAAETLKQDEMESAYGILPLPLWDEAQYADTGYVSGASDNHNGVFVPSNLGEDELDMVGMITEALCMYSRSTVVNAYYEDNLKYRTDMDERVVSVLDIVRSGMHFTFAQAWGYKINYLYSYYSRAWSNANNTGGMPDRELTTQINILETQQKKLLENLYTEFDKIGIQ